MLPFGVMVELREYHDRGNRSPYGEWFRKLDAEAVRKITTALYRLALGNFSNVKGVGRGVFECKINFGPGYRVYFGKDGETLVILLGGGTKQRQQGDIALAHSRWRDYRQRKKQSTAEE
jgi:putative addiction module killer protein